MPSARFNRRADKEMRRAEASDLEVVSVTPMSKEEQANSSLLKLHILNVRTGKIQDAIIKTDERDFLKPKMLHGGKSSGELLMIAILTIVNLWIQ